MRGNEQCLVKKEERAKDSAIDNNVITQIIGLEKRPQAVIRCSVVFAVSVDSGYRQRQSLWNT